MEKHLLATHLVAIALLLSTLGCSKKNDPAVKQPAIVASYMLSGTLIKCTASSQVVNSGLGTDYLTLTLTTTPRQPLAHKGSSSPSRKARANP
jgi:hypothetical protein